MAEQTERRAECPACHKSVALRKDGMLWHHTGNEPEWPGSPFKAFCPRRGLPPEPDAPSKRRRRSQPDWADLREMARNAGWTRDRGEYGTTWGHFEFGAILDRSHGMAYVNKGNRRVYLAGPGGDEHRTVVLYDPTPAEFLAAARLVGLGGAS